MRCFTIQKSQSPSLLGRPSYQQKQFNPFQQLSSHPKHIPQYTHLRSHQRNMPGKKPHITSKNHTPTARSGPDLSFREHQIPRSQNCHPESHVPGPRHQPISATPGSSDGDDNGNDNNTANSKAEIASVKTTKNQDNDSVSAKLEATPDLKQAQALIAELVSRSANKDVVCRIIITPHHRRRPNDIARHPHERPGLKKGPDNGGRAHQQAINLHKKVPGKAATKRCRPVEHRPNNNGDDRHDGDDSPAVSRQHLIRYGFIILTSV